MSSIHTIDIRKSTLFIFKIPKSDRQHISELCDSLEKMEIFSNKKYNNHFLISTVDIDVKTLDEKQLKKIGLKWIKEKTL